MADIPYCGEDTAVENLRLPETTRSAGSAQGTREHVDGREKMFEIPEFLRKVCMRFASFNYFAIYLNAFIFR